MGRSPSRCSLRNSPIGETPVPHCVPGRVAGPESQPHPRVVCAAERVGQFRLWCLLCSLRMGCPTVGVGPVGLGSTQWHSQHPGDSKSGDGQHGQRGHSGSSSCRWPVRRLCQPCITSCSGPSSVQKVPPAGRVGAPRTHRWEGGRQHLLDCQGHAPPAVEGVPVAPAVLLALGVVGSGMERLSELGLRRHLPPSLTLCLLCSPGWGRAEAQPGPAGAQDGPEQKGHREPGDRRAGHGAVRAPWAPPDTPRVGVSIFIPVKIVTSALEL